MLSKQKLILQKISKFKNLGFINKKELKKAFD